MTKREGEEKNQEIEDMMITDNTENMEVIEVIVEIEEIMAVIELDNSTMVTAAGKGDDTPEVLAGRL